MSENEVLLGTSGWSYKEWIGPFYSKEDKSMLRAYAKVFKTVEIDSTFYRYPSKGMVMEWAKYSPEGFVFTAKLPQLITHEKKLDLNQGVKEDLERFIEIMEPLWLGGKLACILIQLPPSFHFQPEVLDSFFRILPTQARALGVQTPEQKAARNKVQSFLNDQEKMKEMKLEAFAEPTKTSFEELLRFLTAPGRLERTLDIGNDELKIRKETTEWVEADIRDYHITVDIRDNVISHDCADWGKILQTKKFCKHVAKLFLAMDRERATRILASLYVQKEVLQFKPCP